MNSPRRASFSRVDLRVSKEFHLVNTFGVELIGEQRLAQLGARVRF